MKKLRTIIIVIVVAAIVILSAILALIIARGGKLSEGGGLVRTGIIRIEAKPEDVTVFVNGQKTNLQDKQILGLEEGDYRVTIAKEGYSSWERTVRARVGVVVEVYAQLFPTSLNLSEITQTNIDRAFFSDNGEFAVYTVTDSDVGNNLGLWRIRLLKPTIAIGENNPVRLSDINDVLAEVTEANYEIDFSPENKFIKIHNSDTNEYYIINAELYNEPEESLNDELGYSPDRVDWFRNSSSLIISKGDAIFEYDLEEKTSTLISLTPDNNPVYGVNQERVVFYNHNNGIVEYYERDKSQELEIKNITLPASVESIFVAKNDPELLLMKASGKFYYLNVEKSFLDELEGDLEFISFAQNGLSALFRRGTNLLSFTVEEFVSENRFKTELLTVLENFDPEIHHVMWNSSSAHILVLSESETLKTLTIYDRDGGNATILLTDKRITNRDFSMTSDNSLLNILMNDEVKENGETHVLRTNLYELDLEEGIVKTGQ
ncbi:MAG TPA: PEGA domain-containing protein [bacterium]|nr:PEGA domain-containing protein [bacterium]